LAVSIHFFASASNTSTGTPEQVVGTASGTKYGYDKDGRPFLTKEPKLPKKDSWTVISMKNDWKRIFAFD
jgi:hypothetical protein